MEEEKDRRGEEVVMVMMGLNDYGERRVKRE